jgi:hypothetical protein
MVRRVDHQAELDILVIDSTHDLVGRSHDEAQANVGVRGRKLRNDGGNASRESVTKGASEFLCARRSETFARRRSSLATNERRGGQVGGCIVTQQSS